MRPKKCDLCGLPLHYGNHTVQIQSHALHFCCRGCRMVYTMLAEAADSPDPVRFKETELYRRCVAAGVVPSDEMDLAEKHRSVAVGSTLSETRSSVEYALDVQFVIGGMWCPACSWVIHTALERLEGVIEARCDFATDRLQCRYDPTRLDPETIVATINGLGYASTDVGGAASGRRERSAFVRLIITALLSANVMMLSWSLYTGFFTSLEADDVYFISLPILVMASVVMLYGGGALFRKAWWGVRTGAPGMEALVCLGAGSAYGYSLVNFWMGSWHLYFDTASMLITLVLLGKSLESKAKRNVRRDLESFLALQPAKVRICSDRYPSGRFAAIDQLRPADRFRVKDDEIVPADGRVVSGRALIDSSAVTGESRPKNVSRGANIVSGTRLLEGDVTVVAQKVGTDALLGEMIVIIERGLSRQTAVQNRTDRILAFFVPLMILVAVMTTALGYWFGLSLEQAFVRGLTVLVIACPCALGIAIPLARIAGLSQAGRKGILVRDIEAFEQAKPIDCVVMDKTGTLTIGQWPLTQVTVHGALDERQAVAVAAGLEQFSDHAVARSILDYARRHGIEPARIDDAKTESNGMRGSHQGRLVKIGSMDFATGGRRDYRQIEPEQNQLSHVYLSLDHQICATLGFSDQLRRSAKESIRRLNKAGIALFLVSGDAPDTTQALAAEVGIEQAHGGLLPQEKSEFVERLQIKGYRVAVLGDGINDAPALAQADLSVALHHDSALTQQAAAVTLMQSEPMQFISFMDLARRVNRKVIQNLGCAWIYNLVSIPIAMSGLLNPLVAVSAMLFSSLTVIGNTLSLVRRAPDDSDAGDEGAWP
ncbi:MAG: heavy metal translocating P-type ATPase [Desulfobacteraceae bacterium]